jgi:hypothetical protein
MVAATFAGVHATATFAAGSGKSGGTLIATVNAMNSGTQ